MSKNCPSHWFLFCYVMSLHLIGYLSVYMYVYISISLCVLVCVCLSVCLFASMSAFFLYMSYFCQRDSLNWLNWLDWFNLIDSICLINWTDLIDLIDWIHWIDLFDWTNWTDWIDRIDSIDWIDWFGLQLSEAEACLIMSNPTSTDPDSEDAANIMRVIAVKNYDPKVRVIVQLMHYRNKVIVACN